MAAHSRHVTATDVSPRCLDFARFNADLNGFEIDFRRGSLFEPAVNERYDLVVSNPPFVIAAPESARHTYRDSGWVGDDICAGFVSQVHHHLNDGGHSQLLANWEITDPEDWALHPRAWLGASPLDAWVVQRDIQDPAAYVSTWLADSGEIYGSGYTRKYDEWLGALDDRGVVGIGFGLINLRAGRLDSPLRVIEHVSQPWSQPVGGDIQRWFPARTALLDYPGQSLLELPLVANPEVHITEHSMIGGSEVLARTISQDFGLSWFAEIDEFGIKLLQAADGTRSTREILDQLSQEYGNAAADCLNAAQPLVAKLLIEDFLRLGEDADATGTNE